MPPMKHDVQNPGYSALNLQDPIKKTVGRRRLADGFAYGMGLQDAGAGLLASLGCRGIPKGVYRFKTHQEANEWQDRMTTRP